MVHTVLIRDDVVEQLGLHRHILLVPEVIQLAMEGNGKKVEVKLTEWVKLKLCDISSSWCAKSVCAIIISGLCTAILLSLPFLSHNHIVIGHHACMAIDKTTSFDLLNLDN